MKLDQYFKQLILKELEKLINMDGKNFIIILLAYLKQLIKIKIHF